MTEATKGRVIVLTGAGGGLGAVMVTALLEAGHSIAAVDQDGNALVRLLERLQMPPDRLLSVAADVSSEDECNEAIETTAAHFGRVDGLVNNAGIGMSAIRPDAETRHPGIEELSVDIWDRFYMVNVRGPMMMTRAAVPHMRQQGWGRMVNNTTSYKTMLRVLPYGAMKSALESMSAVWAQQLDGSGITVNVLVPGGPTDTPFIADEAGWPRDKMLRPEIMAAPIRWLMSEASNGTTGRRITASEWDVTAAAGDAAAQASRGIGWPELASNQTWW